MRMIDFSTEGVTKVRSLVHGADVGNSIDRPCIPGARRAIENGPEYVNDFARCDYGGVREKFD